MTSFFFHLYLLFIMFVGCYAPLTFSGGAGGGGPTVPDSGTPVTITRPSGSTTPYEVTLSYTANPKIYNIEYDPVLVTGIDMSIAHTIIELDSIPQAKYSYQLLQLTSTTYQVTFTVTEDIPVTVLKFTYQPDQQILSYSFLMEWTAQINTLEMPLVWPIPPPTLTSPVVEMAQVAETTGVAVTATMGAVSGVIIILGGNPAILWALVTLLQTFYYLVFIKVSYPENLQVFMRVFKIGGLDFIPNPIVYMAPEIEEETLPAPERFEEYEVNGLFLANAGNMLLLWAVTFLIYAIALLGKYLIKGKSKIVSSVLQKIVSWFEWSGVFRALMTSYIDVAQAAFLQVRVTNFDSTLFSVSSALGIIFAVFIVIFPVSVAMLIRNFSKNQTYLVEKYGALVEGYNLDKTFPKYFAIFSLFQRLFFILSLIFLHDYPYLQMSCLTGLSIATVLLSIFLRPYSSRVDNITNIISEALTTGIYVLIFFLVQDNILFSEDTRINIGWGVIGCCGTILAINFGKAMVEQYFTLKAAYAYLKNYFSKKQTKTLKLNKEQKSDTMSKIQSVDTSVENLTNVSISSNQTLVNISHIFQRTRGKRIRPANKNTNQSIHINREMDFYA